jgi:uncharacterized protein DUF4382
MAACAALVGCDTAVNVDATSNVTANYSSVLVTVKEVWVNESATAGPEDTTWQKFPLDEPQTLELVNATDGTLQQLASSLSLPAGTYHQMRLILADRTETLTSSASSANATYNDQVTYLDADGNSVTLPLELANAAQGIGIEMNLEVPAATEAILAALGSAAATNSSSTTNGSTSGSTEGSTTGTTTDTTGSTLTVDDFATSSTDTTSTTTTPTVAAVSDSSEETVTATASIVFDAARDLTAFNVGDARGFLLNPTLAAYDPKDVGTIQGTLDLSLITIPTGGTGRPEIQVTAEDLNADGTRRIVIGSAPVQSNGSFVLYPLPLKSAHGSSTTTYDIVIHGPGVRTVIVRAVPVTKGTPSGTSNVLSALALSPAESYSVNVASSSPVTQRGARVGFYQSVPDDTVPYLIELRTVDPLTGLFATDENLSGASTIVYGTYASSLSLAEAAPQEGAANYRVAAVDSLFGDGSYSETVLAPPSTTSDTATFSVPALSIPSSAAAGTIAATVNVASPGKYDKGALVITHDGAVVAVAALDSALTSGATAPVVIVENVPGSTSSGFAQGLYYAEAWAWSSSDPSGSFTRQPSASAIDLRSTVSANAALTLN